MLTGVIPGPFGRESERMSGRPNEGIKEYCHHSGKGVFCERSGREAAGLGTRDEDRRGLQSRLQAGSKAGCDFQSRSNFLKTQEGLKRALHGACKAYRDLPRSRGMAHYFINLPASEILPISVVHSARRHPKDSHPVCADCQLRMDLTALRVAPFVPQLDWATVKDLEAKLPRFSWDLDETTNVPHCSGEDCTPLVHLDAGDDSFRCYASQPYIHHLKAAYAGFSSSSAYLANFDLESRSQRAQLESKYRPPTVTLDDDDLDLDFPRQPSPDRAVASDASNADLQACKETPDLALVEHMRLIRLQQAVRGRLVMNDFLHSDAAARNRLEGVMVALRSRFQCVIAKCDETDGRLDELEQCLGVGRRELARMEQDLAALEDERQRKYPKLEGSSPLDSMVDELGPTTSENMFTPSSSTTVGRIQVPLTSFDPVFHDLSSTGLSKLSPAHLDDLRKRLKTMGAPAYHQPPELFARWLQVCRDTRIKGIPTCAPDWIVDLRDIRGRNVLMSRVPGKGKKREAVHHHAVCLFAVLRVLARPGAYLKILTCLGSPVAQEVTSSCAFKEGCKPGTDEDVVQVLAAQGLTTEAANDAWQFAVKLLEAHVADAHSRLFDQDEATALLNVIKQETDVAQLPPGIYSVEHDQLPRFEVFAKTVVEISQCLSVKSAHIVRELGLGELSTKLPAIVGDGYCESTATQAFNYGDLVQLIWLSTKVNC
ncbi:hypothetical protein C8R47DRAFT_1082727 [Mycena vitilis]|nr:hypothetical protein C8R47DRAFT_1082727 [Mycena vitilis]